jgi:predicted phosphodiesterase
VPTSAPVGPPPPEPGAGPAEEPAPPTRRTRRLRRVGLLVLAVFGASVATLLAARVTGPVGPFDATVSLELRWTGGTEVELGPLGSLVVDTHDGPLGLRAQVAGLRVEEAERFVSDPDSLAGVEVAIADDARSLIRRLILRALVAAVAGGAVLAAVRGASVRSAGIGALIGALAGAAVVVVAVISWRPTSLSEPGYRGLLSFAPQAVGEVEDISRRFGEYRSQLAQLVGNVATLYQAGQGLPTFDTDSPSIRVLHVSDVHLNPAAFDLMEQLVEQFDADAVIDSGDTTDFGTVAELGIAESIGELGVPYVWVRGNHDSLLTRDAVAAQPNAVVLEGRTEEVAGLRIWGVGDPRFTPDKSQATGSDREREEAEAFAPLVATGLRRSMPPPVDVVVVHDLRTAADVGELVPLVLAGHTHRSTRTEIGSALALTQGSTGGAGLRALEGDEPVSLSASVLYFDPDTAALQAYDLVTVAGLGGNQARIERHVVAEPLSGEDPS